MTFRRDRPTKKWPAIVAAIAVILIVGAINGGGDKSGSQPAESSSPCSSDWTKCTDNADMANNYKGWFSVKYDCKRQAVDMAKYGTPEFGWLYFSSFYPGSNYSTGIVTVIEPDAKFQNGFGAMVRSRVVCEYDLRAKKVLNISISER